MIYVTIKRDFYTNLPQNPLIWGPTGVIIFAVTNEFPETGLPWINFKDFKVVVHLPIVAAMPSS